MNKIRMENYFCEQEQPLAVHRTLPEVNDIEHEHEFEELVIVDQGSGTHVINGEPRFIQSGDVFYVNRHDYHYYENLGSLGLTNILIRHDIPFKNIPPLRELIGQPEEKGSSFHWRLGIKQRSPFFSLLDQVASTLLQKGSPVIAMRREGLLLQMMSLLSSEKTQSLGHNCDMNIEKLMQTVRDNHCDDIDWRGLSQHYGLSERTLFRQIKNLTGYTPEQYLLMLRLRTARDLIKNTDQTILTIALNCGFKTLSNFSKNYKRVYAQSPVQQRKSYDRN